jgi:hypothetical protein
MIDVMERTGQERKDIIPDFAVGFVARHRKV